MAYQTPTAKPRVLFNVCELFSVRVRLHVCCMRVSVRGGHIVRPSARGCVFQIIDLHRTWLKLPLTHTCEMNECL